MNEPAGEIYSLLVPLATGRLLVPRACVAEITGYQAPASMAGGGCGQGHPALADATGTDHRDQALLAHAGPKDLQVFLAAQ